MALDLNALNPQPAAMPAVTTARGRNAAPNPLVPHIIKSHKDGQALRLDVATTDEAKQLVNRIRNAADKATLGSRVVLQDPNAKNEKDALVVYRSVVVTDKAGQPVRKQYVDKEGVPQVEEDGSPAMYTETAMRFIRQSTGKTYTGPLAVYFQGTDRRERKTDDGPVAESAEATAAAENGGDGSTE